MASLAGIQSQNDETLDLAIVDSFQGPSGSTRLPFFWIHICCLKAWIESVQRAVGLFGTNLHRY
jgi:hypothetical protein